MWLNYLLTYWYPVGGKTETERLWGCRCAWFSWSDEIYTIRIVICPKYNTGPWIKWVIRAFGQIHLCFICYNILLMFGVLMVVIEKPSIGPIVRYVWVIYSAGYWTPFIDPWILFRFQFRQWVQQNEVIYYLNSSTHKDIIWLKTLIKPSSATCTERSHFATKPITEWFQWLL